jgi:hypothetical protein
LMLDDLHCRSCMQRGKEGLDPIPNPNWPCPVLTLAWNEWAGETGAKGTVSAPPKSIWRLGEPPQPWEHNQQATPVAQQDSNTRCESLASFGEGRPEATFASVWRHNIPSRIAPATNLPPGWLHVFCLSLRAQKKMH